MLITFNKADAETSEDARHHVYDQLINDPTFVNAGGRFGASIADWFVIGGRWSGELAEARLKTPFYEQAKSLFANPDAFGYSMQEVKEKEPELQALWERLGGTDTNPMNRDTYLSYGYEDDAQIVDQALYDKLIKEYEGSDGDDLAFVDLNWDIVSPEYIGKKWLVVVDYHS